MNNIINSRSLGIKNTLSSYCEVPPNFSPYVLISTPFSLPFSVWANRNNERIAWLYSRFTLFEKALKRCIINQKPLDTTIVWVIFLSIGDREILKLPHFEQFNNNILVLYVEIGSNSSVDDNYYRLVSIPFVLKKVIRMLSVNTMHNKIPVITIRIDSDDLVSKDYIYLMTYCIYCAHRERLKDLFLAFEHGMIYNILSRRFAPRIWPEPAFLVRYEYNELSNIKTVWEFPHDSIPLSYNLIHLTTTIPQWCITIGGQNLLNRMIDYNLDIYSSVELFEIFA